MSPDQSRNFATSLSKKLRTQKTIKSRFWPWLFFDHWAVASSLGSGSEVARAAMLSSHAWRARCTSRQRQSHVRMRREQLEKNEGLGPLCQGQNLTFTVVCVLCSPDSGLANHWLMRWTLRRMRSNPEKGLI